MIDAAVLYVYGWIETLTLALLCLALLGAAWKMPKVLLVTTIMFAGIFVARSLPLVFGAHTVLAIIVLALLVSVFFSISIGRTLVAASLSLIVLIVIELIVMAIVRSFADVDLDPVLWLLGRLPIVVLLLAAALLVRRQKLTLPPGRVAGRERGA